MNSNQTRTARKAGTALIALGVVSTLAVGCASDRGTGGSAEAPILKSTLTQVTSVDPNTLNPVLPGGATDKIVGCMLYQGLTRVNADYEAEPLLAKDWEISDDGTVYTFNLEKAEFSDGTPMTSEDVVYSLTEVVSKYSSAFASAAKAIDTVQALDEDTVEIRLKHPYGPLLLTLSCDLGSTAILPAHVFAGTDPAQNEASTESPVGTGPFMLASWDRGSQLTLERNTNYWKADAPLLEKVVYKVMPSAGARTIALLSGEVDYIYHYFIDRNGLSKLEEDDRFQVSDAGPAGDYDLVLNNRNAPFNDPQVRQALMMAIDREFLIDGVMKGYGEPAKSSISSQIEWAYNPDVDLMEEYPYDPEAARELLEEAGQSNLTVRLAFDSTKPVYAPMADAIAAFWKEIGVNTVLEGAEATVVNDKVFKEWDFDATLQGYTSLGDPALGIARKYVSSSIGQAVFNNASGYSNPEVDRLFEEGANSTAQEDRAVAYREAQEILAEDLPLLPLIEVPNTHAAVKGLTGMYTGLQQYGDWWDQVSIQQ